MEWLTCVGPWLLPRSRVRAVKGKCFGWQDIGFRFPLLHPPFYFHCFGFRSLWGKLKKINVNLRLFEGQVQFLVNFSSSFNKAWVTIIFCGVGKWDVLVQGTNYIFIVNNLVYIFSDFSFWLNLHFFGLLQQLYI